MLAKRSVTSAVVLWHKQPPRVLISEVRRPERDQHAAGPRLRYVWKVAAANSMCNTGWTENPSHLPASTHFLARYRHVNFAWAGWSPSSCAAPIMLRVRRMFPGTTF
jgi:hypothetical protein